MFFLTLATTLGLAMYAASTTTTASATNLVEAERARTAAESGLRWAAWRFTRMTRPKTTVGNITASVATTLWPTIRTSISNDYAAMLTPAERTLTWSGGKYKSASIAIGNTGGGATDARFVVEMQQHPLYTGDPLDARYIRVTSTGTYKSATRSMSLDFKIDKKVKYAIVGKVPIQLGRSTLVEGPIAMATPDKYPPVYMLSDFRHLNSQLATKIDNFSAFLKLRHKGYDNRVSVNNPDEYNYAVSAGYSDTNGDSYIDEYDLFLKHYDANNDKKISSTEFTNPVTGQKYDADLFTAIDNLGGPLYTGDPLRDGYQDGIIDNRDGYTKVRGQIALATTANAWESNLGSQDIQDMIKGPISPTDTTELPVKFAATSTEMIDLNPANFEQCALGFKARSGTNAGTPSKTSTVIQNTVLAASDANGGSVTEKTPFGSTVHQATYKRPKFQNITFKNVQIPKGLNALFDNCKFEGVTWVEGERDITTSGGSVTTNKDEGMNWAQRKSNSSYANFDKDKALISSGTPNSSQTRTEGSTKGNNLRFNNCTFEGPISGNYATAYTHFANSWEFTGSTLFNNKADQTATIVSPQVNIEMGSFTDPSAAPSTLIGVVVAGNLDIRGSGIVDGSIIITGDGAGNTTQGWFGPSDASTDPSSPMPEGGWGRLNIRYNQYRALPDGINIAIDILPEIDTYLENQ